MRRPLRLLPRAVLLSASLALFATQADAQRRRPTPRKKPFAEFSESARRLKGSVRDRLLGRGSTDRLLADSLSEETLTQARDSVIAVARSQLGTRYIWGAELPGRAFDCSGFVRFVMGALRLDLPRTAHGQSQHGTSVARDVKRLRPGDLLTFGESRDTVTHIGIYVGNGRFVHASTTARKVVESSISSPNWYTRNWLGARRLIASRDTIATDGQY